MVSKPGFNLGTNLKINLDGDDTKVAKTDKPDVKSKEVEMIKTEPDVKPKVTTKPVIKPNKEHEQDVKPNRPDIKQNIETNKITYEEEKAALVLGTTAVFTVWWMFK